MNEKETLQFKKQKGTTYCHSELKVNLKFHSDSNLNLNRRNIGRFRRFVDEMELKDVPLHGRYFTWSNERENATLEKLDRLLVTVDWELLYPACFLQALSSDMSDHCPLHLTLNAAFNNKRRFHFENFWLKILGYLEAVERRWRCPEPPTASQTPSTGLTNY